MIRNKLELATRTDHSSYVSPYSTYANTSSLMNLSIKLTLILSVCVFSSFSTAKSAATEAPNNAQQTVCKHAEERPCIALVLGGGGAKGSAHVGVLRAIEEYGIPIDFAVGTSIGSFVSGLYATGKSSRDIEELFLRANWNQGYQDDLPRSRTPNRRKRQNDAFPIQLGIGLGKEGIKLPKGIIQGQGMKAMIDTMLGSYPEFKSFNELTIPYRAVAADLETGEQVILSHGDLGSAMQASMSLPGVLRPIERDGRVLVDGGIANNLPINVAKNMGVDIVIAVDIGAPALTRDEINSSFEVLGQLSNFLTKSNQARARAMIQDRDLLIQPDLEGIGLLSFDMMQQGIERGYQAGIKAIEAHQELSKLAHKKNILNNSLNTASTASIEQIILDNKTRLGDEYVLHRMGLSGSPPFTQDQINKGIEKLYGQGTVARVSSIRKISNDQEIAFISIEEKEWGPGYLDFEFSFEDNFRTFSLFEIGASWRLTNLSPYGAEWVNSVEFGTEKSIISEIYWPLSTSGFFLQASAEYFREVSAYIDAGNTLGDLIISAQTNKGALGYEFSDRFDLITELEVSDGEIDLPDILVSQVGYSNLGFEKDAIAIRAEFDSLDEADFARSGWKMVGEVQRNRTTLSNDEYFANQVEVELTLAHSFGAHTIKPTLRAGNSSASTISTTNFELGGFLNLSGNDRDFISGPYMRFARLVYTYELAENLLGGTSLPLYFGLSYEAGNTWERREDISVSSMISSGAIFLGWDSPIGPAFLGYGLSENSNESLYVSLGKRF